MPDNNDLILQVISDVNSPVLAKLKNTYLESFPADERRDFSLFLSLISNEPRFKVYVCFKSGSYVGFISCWQFDTFAYVEHFAIDASSRNGGIGSRFFKSFQSLISTPVVLEVERPVDDLTRRRVSFYQRLGLVLDSHDYIQPPYREGDEWLPLRLMTIGEIDLSVSFESVRATIYREAYQVEA